MEHVIEDQIYRAENGPLTHVFFLLFERRGVLLTGKFSDS